MNALENLLKNNASNKNKNRSVKNAIISQVELQAILNNPPFNNEDLGNKFGNNTILRKSYERKRKNAMLIPPVSKDMYFRKGTFTEDQLKKIKAADFWKFCNENVITKGYSFIDLGSVETRMEYSHDLLVPLTELQGEIKSVGIKVFRTIYKICEDRKRIQLPFTKVRKLIQILLTSPQEVKDEFYLQIVKQMRSNPNSHNNNNEWILLAIVAGFVSPSEYFFFNLHKYLFNVVQSSHNQETRMWACYSMRRIFQTKKNGERTVLPCVDEIRNIEKRRQIPLEIYYLNGASEILYFESYTTVQELKNLLFEKYEFDLGFESCFGLYEICKKNKINEENYVEDPIKVIIIRLWTSWDHGIMSLNISKIVKAKILVWSNLDWFLGYVIHMNLFSNL